VKAGVRLGMPLIWLAIGFGARSATGFAGAAIPASFRVAFF
jgi:hypothetical protein